MTEPYTRLKEGEMHRLVFAGLAMVTLACVSDRRTEYAVVPSEVVRSQPATQDNLNVCRFVVTIPNEAVRFSSGLVANLQGEHVEFRVFRTYAHSVDDVSACSLLQVGDRVPILVARAANGGGTSSFLWDAGSWRTDPLYGRVLLPEEII